MPTISIDKSYYFLSKIIFFLIFYQQILTINIGGSLKIYECLLALMTLLFFFDRKIADYTSLILLFFFVVTPLLSLVLYFYENIYAEYYWKFPEASKMLRFNPVIAPLLIFGYNVINWVGYNCISKSKLVFKNTERIISIFIISGTLVCIYSLYAHYFIYNFKFPDIVPSIFDSRNSSPQTQPRLAGFSSEPGTFVYLLAWMVIYLIFYKNIFSKKFRYILLALSTFCLLMTMSTAIIGIALAFLIFALLCIPTRKMIEILLLIILLCGAVYSQKDNPQFGILRYSFFEKVERFLVGTQHTSGSGAMRSYTSLLGLQMFKDYPILGVGSGNSYFFLWRYEYSTKTVPTIEHLNYSTPPQNSHSKILAERGLVGYGFFIIFIFVFINKIRSSKLRGKISNNIFSLGLISTFMFFIILLSIYPIYSFFLWANLALLNNTLNFSHGRKV